MSSKVTDFLQQVKAELEKVTWPTRKEATGSTVVVVVLVLMVAVFLWLVDSALSLLIRNLLN
ncbi:MAG: preprotein translocase subunit SecE [Desulfuromonadales bacterium]|nr:preprotein translocase subunit SecE [Desulfuromonadales bacterium]